MAIQAVSTIKPQQKKNRFVPTVALGAVGGAAVRYVVPTKNEIGQVVNKDAFKKAASKTAALTRGESRSILKFAGFGALIAGSLNITAKAINCIKKSQDNMHYDYSKYGAFFDSGECACEVMWLG